LRDRKSHWLTIILWKDCRLVTALNDTKTPECMCTVQKYNSEIRYYICNFLFFY
jgi:hypothetical protein